MFVATIAQSVEQRTENPRVAGSIPARGTIEEKVILKFAGKNKRK
jgi:hypothetical protein